MDPFSIVGTVSGLVLAVSKVTAQAHSLKGSFKDAPSDVELITRDLVSLSSILAQLESDLQNPVFQSNPIPGDVQSDTRKVLESCKKVFQRVEGLAKSYDNVDKKTLKKMQWAMTGHGDATKLSRVLGDHKQTLQLTLLWTSNLITKHMSHNIDHIEDNTRYIMGEMQDLRLRLSHRNSVLSGVPVDSRIILTRFLQSATSYAGSVIGPEEGAKSLFSRSASISSLRPSEIIMRPKANGLDALQKASEQASQSPTLSAVVKEPKTGDQGHIIPRDVEINVALNLGTIYFDQGKYDQAVEMYKRALVDCEECLGSEHPETMLVLYNLAGTYSAQGKFAEAEELDKRALQGWKKSPSHDLSILEAKTMCNLGSAVAYQGRHVEAGELFERALRFWEKSPDHDIDTSKAASNLGNSYTLQGRHDEATEMFRRATGLLEKRLGSEDPNTLTALYKLALSYTAQDRHHEAEKLYERLLAARTSVEAIHSQPAVKSDGNMAAAAAEIIEPSPIMDDARQPLAILNADIPSQPQSRQPPSPPASDEGEQSQKIRTPPLDAFRKPLIPKDKSTISAAFNLGCLYKEQARPVEAEGMFKKALELHKNNSSRERSDTFFHLGMVYVDQGRLNKAEEAYNQALEGLDDIAIFKDQLMMIVAYNLACTYRDEEKHIEAGEWFKRLLEGHELTLGADHPDTLADAYNLALVYSRQGRLDEAEEMYKRALGPPQKQSTSAAAASPTVATPEVLENGDGSSLSAVLESLPSTPDSTVPQPFSND